MFVQTFFIVWRESIEALLVVGILHAWLRHNGTGRGATGYLWSGVAAGIIGAGLLSVVLMRFSAALPPEGQDWFQAALILAACALIVQMVFWMRRHGRTLKRDLEQGLSESLRRGNLWGIFAVAAIAVMREGAETVIFLQGVIVSAAGTGGQIAVGIVSAVLAAGATYGLLQLGGRYLSWRLFFRLTEAMLLLLASALLVTGTGYLISLGLLPYSEPLWDTSFLLDDMTRLGGIVAGLTGYRAMPDAVTVATWVLYWSGIMFAFRMQARQARPVAQASA
ncbi:MAG: FTR1 family protein [Rhizobiaceae bacterium]|nr:FTR1 family protein [Rhizobiaceae bacterium]